jgi:phytoene dehydrogenase-like protein
MGAITQAMAKEAINLGVSIKTQAEVKNIEISKQQAKIIHLADGSSITADIVVSNVNPKLLFQQLIEPENLSDEIFSHFKSYKCQSGTFRMNVALDSLPKFTADMPEFCLEAGIIMSPSLDYMDQAFTDARRNGWAKKPIVEMLIPSTIDSTLTPPGKHVASLFCQQFNPDLGSEWDNHREKVADNIIDTVDNYAPGFTDSVLARQIHSPWDLEQKFGLTGGDIFHGRLSLDQLFSVRPMLGMAQYQTEINNLFMCGSGTHPGGGVSGIPGHNAAREIIRKN